VAYADSFFGLALFDDVMLRLTSALGSACLDGDVSNFDFTRIAPRYFKDGAEVY